MRFRGLAREPGSSPIPRPTVLATVPVRTDVARVSSALRSFSLPPLRFFLLSWAPAPPGSEELIKSDQVNGVLVLSLLDKIIGAVDQIQLTQAQLEERQAEMEGAVQSIQGELSKLGKAHATTSNTVSKLLEKVRKVSVNVKTVRGSLERQAGQIKKLEVNEAELLRRRNFKVMIYQPKKKLKAPSDLATPKIVPFDLLPETEPFDLKPETVPELPLFDQPPRTLPYYPEPVPLPTPEEPMAGGGT
uniref:Caveolae associated protein 1 n=1 Tax=Canis lupus familiaris TaxID=9615 RepID=A0A8C0QJM9_CANLF